jgi:hypothetical protein
MDLSTPLGANQPPILPEAAGAVWQGFKCLKAS